MFLVKKFCLVIFSLIGPTKILAEECEHGKHYQNLNDCRKFAYCSHGEILDLSCDEDRYWNANINSCDFRSNVICPVVIPPTIQKATTTTTTTTPIRTTWCDCLKNKVPLYRLYYHSSGDHFYTTSLEEANNAADVLGYTREGTTGWVLPSTSTFSYNEKYIPVHRLYNGQKSDHFYTANEAEARTAAESLRYTREGIAFYCAVEQEECENYGSKVPLHRYNRGTDHFYTTSLYEGSVNVIPYGGTYEGILCYIWTS